MKITTNADGLVTEQELLKVVPIKSRTLRAWRKNCVIAFVQVKRVILYDVPEVLRALSKFKRQVK